MYSPITGPHNKNQLVDNNSAHDFLIYFYFDIIYKTPKNAEPDVPLPLQSLLLQAFLPDIHIG